MTDERLEAIRTAADEDKQHHDSPGVRWWAREVEWLLDRIEAQSEVVEAVRGVDAEYHSLPHEKRGNLDRLMARLREALDNLEEQADWALADYLNHLAEHQPGLAQQARDGLREATRRLRGGESEGLATSHWETCYGAGPEHYQCALAEIDRLRGGEGERESRTPEWLKENLPRDWNYRIHVRGVGGVTIRAWDYETPETEEFVAEVTQVDPRETRDDRDLLGQIKLGLERIASRDALSPTDGEEGDDDG